MSYNISNRIYIRSLERAMRASVPVKVLPLKPATKPEGLAVAAAAHPADSKLPAPGATPGVGHLPKP